MNYILISKRPRAWNRDHPQLVAECHCMLHIQASWGFELRAQGRSTAEMTLKDLSTPQKEKQNLYAEMILCSEENLGYVNSLTIQHAWNEITRKIVGYFLAKFTAHDRIKVSMSSFRKNWLRHFSLKLTRRNEGDLQSVRDGR